MKGYIIGDLHFSDKFVGRHKDYLGHCKNIANRLTKDIKEVKPDKIFLLGDIIGLTEKNFTKRENLLYFMNVFAEWKSIVNGELYIVEGNHDKSSKMTDYEFLVGLGYFKRADYVDMNNMRIHLIDYGKEREPIEISEDKANIALMHQNIMIEGETTWYRGGKGIELSSLENLYGIEMIIAGHIHEPSLRLVSDFIKDIKVDLLYPGNLTVPRYEANLWEQAFTVVLESRGEFDDITNRPIYIGKSEDIYVKTLEDVDEEMLENMDVINQQQLAEILTELQTYGLLGNVDYKEQLSRLGGLDKEASKLAIKYLEEVE